MAIYNYIMLLLPLLSSVVSGSPILDKRAGGPAAVPIPSNCTKINPLPHAHCGTGNVNGYAVSPTFSNTSALYSSYYSASGSVAEASDFCFKQCYGFGPKGVCKSAVFARNVPKPKGYFGTAGGVLEDACLMYMEYLSPLDFVKAEPGQWTNATAVSIYCPS
jgi:hypothetical protein